MTFWITTIALAAFVSLVLAKAMLRGRHEAEPAAAYDIRVYRDQLKEVDRDVDRGLVSPEDAERVRTEISRRILAADAQLGQADNKRASGRSSGAILIGAIVAPLILGSLALYYSVGAPGYGDFGLNARKNAADVTRAERPSQAIAEQNVPELPVSANTEYAELVQKLRETVEKRPDDLQGHILLARSEAQLGNFVAAYAAQEKILQLKGDAATVNDQNAYAELLILAAGGYVSPEAETILRGILQRDAENGSARYFLGLMMAQTGRPDVAFRMWRDLLNTSPSDSPWISPIRNQIEEMAMLAGVRFQLPELQRGPSADDVAAAQEMTAQERNEMIRGMVDGLSDRLATEGGPPEDWARLIGALGVLGDEQQAIAIYNNALEVFDGNEAAIDTVRNGARQAGLIP